MIICSPQLGINPESVLGGEVFDREILLGLAKKGVKVEIILPKNKPHDKNVKNLLITYLWLTHFPAILANIIYLPYLFNIYKKNPFHVLRIHRPQFYVAASIFKFFHPKLKLIATYHKFEETKFGPSSKIINNLWDHIICDSHHVKNLVVKHYNIKPAKITVVHNGVPLYLKPTPKDETLTKKLKLENKIVLLFMGLFIKRKNPLFLLDLLAKLSQTRSDLVLIFWGKGPLKTQIIEKAKKLQISKQVRIIDPIFGPEKNKIHNLADIFVHPAIDEGFALAPLEAMACAKPIVITNGYSASEAVADGLNGFLCHSNDTNHWSKKLSELIDNQKLRMKMGQVSYEKVKKEFQWKFAVENTLKVL